MKTTHNVSLFFLFIILSVIALFLAEDYKQKKMQSYQDKQLENMAITISNEVSTLIAEKQNATLAMALAYTQNQENIVSLYNDPQKQKKLEALSLRIRSNSDFKNIWIHLLDKNGRSVVKSWTEDDHKEMMHKRFEVEKMLHAKKIMNLISVGLYDMTFKTMIPIFDKEKKFVGCIEFISHFNSIAEKIKEKGFEPVILVDERYSKKIKFPFTQKFIGSHYIANKNVDEKILHYIGSYGIENFLSKTQNYVIEKNKGYVAVNHILFDLENKPMANFLMLKPLSSIDYSSMENIRLNIDFIYIIFVMFLGFVMYLIANKEKKDSKDFNKHSLFLFITLYVLTLILFYTALKYSYDQKEDSFLHVHDNTIEKDYNRVLEHFHMLARTMYEVVINKQQVYALIEKAYESKDDKNKARTALYELLLQDYEFFKGKDLRQFHFHLKNNESFLRFHRPELHGDNLAEIRKTVEYVNKNHVAISGYEEGKIYNGFRHVFPLFKPLDDVHTSYLGSVEVSFSSYAVLKEFMHQKDTKVGFLLAKRDVNAKNFEQDRLKNYVDSEFKSFYYEQSIKKLLEHQFKHLDVELLRGYEEKIEELVMRKDIFSIVVDNRNTIFTFIPIKNMLTDDVSAVLVVEKNDESLNNLKSNFSIFLFSGFVIITLLFLYVYKEFTTKRKLKNLSKKIQNIFDFQREIVVISDGKEVIDANKRLLDFFAFKDFEEFKKEYHCISDKFENYEKVFHKGKIKNGMGWIEAIQTIPQKERIVAMSNHAGIKHIFSVFIGKLDDEYVVSFSDISDTILEQFSLKERVKRDILTGAYNREFFDENIALIKIEAKNRNLYLGVVIFDIDLFKNVNDTFGHSCGDIVLIDLVKLIQKNIRKEDVLIRWGGEEFLLLIMAESIITLEKIIEGLRKKVEEKEFEDVKHITCSFGVTTYQDDETIQDTIIRADKALYKAKAAGRNKVCYIGI